MTNDRNIASQLYRDPQHAEPLAARFARRAIAQIAVLTNWLRHQDSPTPRTDLLRGYGTVDAFLAVGGNYDALRDLHHRTVLQVHAANYGVSALSTPQSYATFLLPDVSYPI